MKPTKQKTWCYYYFHFRSMHHCSLNIYGTVYFSFKAEICSWWNYHVLLEILHHQISYFKQCHDAGCSSPLFHQQNKTITKGPGWTVVLLPPLRISALMWCLFFIRTAANVAPLQRLSQSDHDCFKLCLVIHPISIHISLFYLTTVTEHKYNSTALMSNHEQIIVWCRC